MRIHWALGIFALGAGSALAHPIGLLQAPERSGMRFGLEVGSSMADIDATSDGNAASTGWQNAGQFLRGSLALALRENVVLGAEYGVLRREYPLAEGASDDGALREGDRYLGHFLFTGDFYPYAAAPRLSGLYFRAGIGVALGYAEVLQASGDVQSSAYGSVLLMGAGYEYRYDESLSFALGLEALAFSADQALTADLVSASLRANFYFPKHF